MAGQNHTLPGPSDTFYSYFNGKNEYVWRFLFIGIAKVAYLSKSDYFKMESIKDLFRQGGSVVPLQTT